VKEGRRDGCESKGGGREKTMARVGRSHGRMARVGGSGTYGRMPRDSHEILKVLRGPAIQWPREGVTGVTKSRGPGPWHALGGPRTTKSCALNEGPGRPNHAFQKGPEKWYMAMTQLYSDCTFGQLMIGTRPYLSCRFGPKGPKRTRERTLASAIRPNWLLVDNYI
jgi:hypothetical protein